eukprot:scaffold12.g7995.t1
MIRWVLLLSRQGKVRLAKWYTTATQKERAKVTKEVSTMVLARPLKLCNFIDWKDQRIVYRRYASLYFVCGVDQDDNELLVLEVIHQFVEVLDKYFGNVCELDLIFNFHKAYFILDELLLAGELQARTRGCTGSRGRAAGEGSGGQSWREPSKRVVSRAIEQQDALVEQAKAGTLQPEAPLGSLSGPRG